jgi:AraC family transcriptional regulator
LRLSRLEAPSLWRAPPQRRIEAGMRRAARTPFAYLSAAPTVRAEHHVDLGAGRMATIWTNEGSRMTYDAPAGHTVSLYLDGGAQTLRLDLPGKRGWSGAVCVMPQGCASDWDVRAPMRFVHLHWPDAELRRAYAETFDRDARLMSLPEETFEDHPRLAALMLRAARAAQGGDPLEGETAAAGLVRAMFGEAPRAAALKGGLSPARRRRVTDYIEARLGEPLRLSDMAGEAGLSEFHFLRSFCDSMGAAPHAYVSRRRIERAKRMLASGDPIAEIAAACGFSSQSHLTRAFRQLTGATPAAWRKGLALTARRV